MDETPSSQLDQLSGLIEKLSTTHVSQQQSVYEEIFHLADSIPEDDLEEAMHESIEMLRQEFVNAFLPNRDFCVKWLQDVIVRKEPQYILDVFHKVFNIFPDISIFAIFYSYMMNAFENEQMATDEVRSHFEYASAICGVDVCTGPIFWKLYRDFEIEECEDLLETSTDPNSVQNAKSHVIRVFRRQLALPLVDNEQVLREFDEFLSRICVESDLHLIDPQSLQMKYASAIEERTERIDFENGLVSEDCKYLSTEHQYSQFWKPYIEFEEQKSEMSRVQRLFERALMECRSYIGCWDDFTAFARYDVKNWNLVEDILGRCSKLHREDVRIWRQLLQAMEVVNRPGELLSKTIHTALQNVFAHAEDYVTLLCCGCDYYRRMLLSVKSTGGTTKKEEIILAIERLRTSFDSAEAFLETYYPSWVEGFLILIRYRVRVEEELIAEASESMPSPLHSKYCSQAEKIWERAIKKFSKHSQVWLECIQWGRANGNTDFCRSLFKKGIASVIDPHTLSGSWVQFECQSGAMESLLEAEEKFRAHRPAPLIEDISHHEFVNLPIARDTHFRSEKRKMDEESNHIGVVDDNEHNIKKSKAAPPNITKPRKFPVFLKNLSFECSQKDIENHFASCEGLLEVKLVLLQGRKFRGSATIDFESEKGQSQAMRLHGTLLLGREVVVEILRAEEGNSTIQPTTVFVSKMNRETSTEELRSHFESCGAIIAARIILDKISGKSKVF